MLGGSESDGAECGVDRFAVALEMDGDDRGLRVGGREGVHHGRAIVDRADEAGGGEVRQPDPESVAVGLGRQVTDEDAPDAGRRPAVAVGLSPDDVRVHAEAAHVLPDLVDDEEIDRIDRETEHEA